MLEAPHRPSPTRVGPTEPRKAKPRRFKRPLVVVGATAALLCLTAVAIVSWRTAAFDAEIQGYVESVEQTAARGPTPAPTPEALAALPAPVRRYFAFAFPDGVPAVRTMRFRLEGTFRRPRTTGFAPMEAHLVTAPAATAFTFWGTTDVAPGISATAMDAYVNGSMRMAAKVLSTLAVVDEQGNPTLDDISRMRFLLEAPLSPTALLPGPHLRWEAIDAASARLIGLRDGRPVGAYRVTFGPDGGISRFDAEPEGDEIDGRYHGAGEIALRSDYQLVGGMRLPLSFEIARRIDGITRPFWRGRVRAVTIDGTRAF